MNEAGVFGRFVPDFGRVVAQMQFDMYHHYTVDEHSIRAIGLLSRIERGELAEDHPLSTALFKQIESRRVLYVAVLLHDIAKGRGGDHSELGAEVALEALSALRPRRGRDRDRRLAGPLPPADVSNTAFRRDLTDPKTIEDFVHAVQSPERLRLLLMLTVVDIRAVGPGTWNDWKRQLLRTLFDAAEERLRLGHKQRGRPEQVAARQRQLAEALPWKASAVRAHVRRLPDSYWLAEPLEWQVANALQIAAAEAAFRRRAEPSVVAARARFGGDPGHRLRPRPSGLFYRICARRWRGRRIDRRRAHPHDARRHGARQSARPRLRAARPMTTQRLRKRLANAVEKALQAGDGAAAPADGRAAPGPKHSGSRRRSSSPTRLRAGRPSSRSMPATGRPAGAAGPGHPFGRPPLHSAHIATYGERAVDVFYLTDALGKKLTDDRPSSSADAARRPPSATARDGVPLAKRALSRHTEKRARRPARPSP